MDLKENEWEEKKNASREIITVIKEEEDHLHANWNDFHSSMRKVEIGKSFCVSAIVSTIMCKSEWEREREKKGKCWHETVIKTWGLNDISHSQSLLLQSKAKIQILNITIESLFILSNDTCE